MDIYVSMAIDAFRKVEQARRRLYKAEAEANKAARRVPKEERHRYILETEIIRMEISEKESLAVHDQEGADVARKLAIQYREQLKELDKVQEGEA